MKKTFIIILILIASLVVFSAKKSFAHPPGNFFDPNCEAGFCTYIKLFNHLYAGGSVSVFNSTPNANSPNWSLINLSNISLWSNNSSGDSFSPEEKVNLRWTTVLPSDPGVRAKIQNYDGYEVRYSFNRGDDAQLIPCLVIDGANCHDWTHFKQFPGLVTSGTPASEGIKSTSFTVPKDWQGELVTFQIIEKFRFTGNNVIYALAYSKAADIKAIGEYTEPTTYKDLSWNLRIKNKIIAVFNKIRKVF